MELMVPNLCHYANRLVGHNGSYEQEQLYSVVGNNCRQYHLQQHLEYLLLSLVSLPETIKSVWSPAVVT